MAKPGDIIVGLDIGTTKTVALVGEVGVDGVDITGVGTARSNGLRKGVVVNIESTVASIREAVESAGNMAGVEIKTVFAGIAGSHVEGRNSHGIVSIADHEVNADDVERVLDQARRISLPMDRQVLHAIPQEFIVDHQDGVREPVGMSGVRLEARVHLVTAALPSVQNVTKCAERCGLEVSELVLEPLASAEAVLTEDEKEIGVALVDIGGGTTDVVLFFDKALVHTAVIPLGGMNLTNDIVAGLRTPVGEAERIKLRHGCALSSLVDAADVIEVPGVGGRVARTLARQDLVAIIEPRMEEMFQLVKRVLDSSGYAEVLGAGVVLTGGAVQLEGTVELAEQVLGLPIRRGSPTGVGGLLEMIASPSMATAVGLLKYGATRPVRPAALLGRHAPVMAPPIAVTEDLPEARSPWRRLWGWFQEVF
ncbi:MAG: cell division protein FtsA [Deltaproteobacteria bacterium]|nr:cell division protein FtsA [Deltaproteobacteria bacterium]